MYTTPISNRMGKCATVPWVVAHHRQLSSAREDSKNLGLCENQKAEIKLSKGTAAAAAKAKQGEQLLKGSCF